MPSEIMDLQGLSSSSFSSEEASYPNERQLGFWKSDAMLDRNVIGKSVASSPLGNSAASNGQPVTSLGHSHSLLIRDSKLSHNLDRHAMGVDRTINQPFSRHPNHDLLTRSSVKMQPSSYGVEGGKVSLVGAEYENSLFSSSLSDLFTRNLRLTSNNAHYGHSVDTVAARLEEVEHFESREDMEAQTIGNLLPSDDDLFTGLTDKLDNINQSTGGNDLDELDFFNSVGGMDLGEDGSEVPNDSEFPGGVSNGQLGMVNGMVGEHPYGEHPSRTLFVRNINSNVEDSELRALFEPYGDVRALYTACKHRGFVMVSYHDIRAARNAMKALQNQPLRRRKLDIHFSIPKDNPTEKDINQGTLVAFNLDSSVSNEELRQIFGVYGEIKEIRETPHRSHHKFIEFYDVRAAEAALRSLNRSDIAGKRIKLEPSRPGGLRRGLLQPNGVELEQDEYGSYLHQSSPPHNLNAGFSGEVPHGAITSSSVDNGTILGVPSAIKSPFMESSFHHGISSSFPDSLPSLLRVESLNNQHGLTEPGQAQGPTKIDIRGTPNFHPHSLPEYPDGLIGGVHCSSPATNINPNPSERLHGIVSNGHSIEFNDGVFGSAGNGNSSLPGHHYGWSNSYRPQPPGMLWPNSPSFVNGISVPRPTPRMHGPPRVPPALVNPALTLNNHHVGSAPTGNPSMWDRHHVYAGESPDTSSFHPGSLGSMRITNNSLQSLEFLNHNIFSHMGGNSLDLSIPSKNVGLQAHHQRSTMFPGRGPMFPVINSFDPPNERRSRRNEGGVNQADKKQYELDVDHILRGDDIRTTLMIKNIPNKYTSKMLLAAIDERHKGTYDFIYLPIDFKNKCNVGYAFINMIDPTHIIPFYQAFDGKKWEKFNSEKVASLAYARIQGRPALIAHFQNSSLMNEDKRCRPILFNTDGPNAGDQVPFPMGVNVRSRTGKPRNITNDDNQPVNPANSVNREDYINGDNSSGSGKEYDEASDLLFVGTNLRAVE